MEYVETLATLVLISFFSTLILTKIGIVQLSKYGMISEDLHKEKKEKKPKIGGIVISGGFAISLFVAYFWQGALFYIMVLFAFLIASAVGLLDDLLYFKPRQKLVLAAIAAMPLLIWIPWEMRAVLLLFGGVAIASNFTNMLAGFNGLESGLGFIMVLFAALNAPRSDLSIVLFVYAAALFAFFLFNKYPAKIFPGDVGTMPIGAMLVMSILLGVPLLKISILFIPHIVDALLKVASVGVISSSDHKPSKVVNGYLIPGGPYLSLSTVLMRMKPLREWELVSIILITEIILGVITLLI